MKRMNQSMLLLTAALALGLTACGGETASSAASSGAASSAAPSSVSEETAQAAVEPLAGAALADPMADGIYSVSFAADAVGDTEGGYTLTATVYAYDQYDLVDISALAAGDTILAHTGEGGAEQEIRITSVETTEDGRVVINGGTEEGGLELTPEDTCYRTVTMDDLPVYYAVGEVTLPLSDEAVLSDSSADPQAEAVTTTGAAALAEAVAAEESGWSCTSTTIRVENGAVVEINRIWVP